MKLINPIILASGTCGYGTEMKDFTDLSKIGGIVTNTITLEADEGLDYPRIAEVQGGMLTAIGQQNNGLKMFVEKQLPKLKKQNVNVIVNIRSEAQNKKEDKSTASSYAKMCNTLSDNDMKADAIEIEIPGEVIISNDATIAFIAEIKKACRTILIVRLPFMDIGLKHIIKAIEEGGADAISIALGPMAMSFNMQSKKNRLSSTESKFIGSAIKPIGLKMTYEAYKLSNLPIIAGCGVFTVNDILEFIMAGATAVQLDLVNYIYPRRSQQLSVELSNYCIENKLASILDIVGEFHK